MAWPDKNFLLESRTARNLYFGQAASCPVVDFHNHLSAKDIASERTYSDIGELWVQEDPYKHRAMRIAGIDERFISGDASSKEKFDAWCAVFPLLAGNPLQHWSAMELVRYFGVEELPSAGNGDSIWDRCNASLGEGGYIAADILRRAGVVRMSTSDDLLDDVSVHRKASLVSGIDVTPSLRADSILALDGVWLDRFPEGRPKTLEELLDAIKKRLDFFEKCGCRLSDHALDGGFSFLHTSRDVAAAVFERLGEASAAECMQLKNYLLEWLGCEYARRGWVMQLHIGAQRLTSARLRNIAGPAGGYACIGSAADMDSLCRLLNTLESRGAMPRMILYSLSASDAPALASLTGSFSESGRQKIKYGPAWWYNDHLAGIEDNLEVISAYSLLSASLGMTTDSRCPLSFVRHEYFRRILCNFIGNRAERGLLPPDIDSLEEMIGNICYKNAEEWIYGKR